MNKFDISNLTLSALAAIYNDLSDKPVKKFSSKAEAVRRTNAALTAAGKTVAVDENATPIWQVVDVETNSNDAGVISVHAVENPKRAGSKSAARFDLYRSGMTVGQYVDAVRCVGQKFAAARGDLRWDVDHGFISIQ